MCIGSFHSSYCSENLRVKIFKVNGFCAVCHFRCNKGHVYRWNASPFVRGTGRLFINEKILFSFHTSGMLLCHFKRFLNFSRIGSMNDHLDNAFKHLFRECVHVEYNNSIQNARFLEVAFVAADEEKPIDILSDARHNCRKKLEGYYSNCHRAVQSSSDCL